MTIVYEKAHAWLRCRGFDGSEFGYLKLSDSLELLLKEHERDTRHSCAEEVLLCETILPDAAYTACLKAKVT